MRRVQSASKEVVSLKAHLAQLEVENDQLINKLMLLSESSLDHDRAIEHLNSLRLSCKKAIKFLNKVNGELAKDKTAIRRAVDILSSALLDLEE